MAPFFARRTRIWAGGWALKLAWPRVLMDPESSRRFVEEPKTVAALSHRGIVEVFDFGQIDLAWFSRARIGRWSQSGRVAAEAESRAAATGGRDRAQRSPRTLRSSAWCRAS